MKILHIIDSLGLGGAQTIVKGIFEYQKDNKDIFLFALRKRNVTVSVNHENVVVPFLTSKYSLKPLFIIKDLIKLNNIDTLHCHLFRSQIFGWVLKVIWFKNIKLIFHEHGQVFQNRLLYNFLIKIFIRQVYCIIAVSVTTKKELEKHISCFSNKIQILYNFLGLEPFKKSKKEKTIFTIGFVGRLSRVKGCKYLIQAVSKLSFPYRLLIAGEGKEQKKLKKEVSILNLENNIDFVGYKENIVEFYDLCDLIVIPSLSESFGLVIIESQARGIPVIASDIPAFSEIITSGINGILFEKQDIISLRNKIELLYKNDNLKNSIIKHGFESIEKYSLREYILKLKDIYE